MMAAHFNHGVCTLTFACVVLLVLSRVNLVLSHRRKHIPVVAFFQGHCGQNFCEQVCRDIDHEGYACDCYHGYRLNTDGITCSKKTKNHHTVRIQDAVIQDHPGKHSPLPDSDTVRFGGEETVLHQVASPGTVQNVSETLNQTKTTDSTVVDLNSYILNPGSVDLKSSDNSHVGLSTGEKPVQSAISYTKGDNIQKVTIKTNGHSPEAPSLESASLHNEDVQNFVPFPLPKYTPSESKPFVKQTGYLEQGLTLGEKCDESSCENDGKCVNDGTEEKNKLRCDCSLGTMGDRCEKEVEVRYPHFYGHSYLGLPVLKNGYKELDILIEFKPSAQFGLLFFSAELEDARSDFFSVVLMDGYVEFRFDCGTGMGVLQSTSPFIMGEWNTVKIVRNDNVASLWLNNEGPVEGLSKGAYSRLTLRLNLYLGGYDRMGDIAARIGTMKGFVGCVEQVVVNGYKYDLRKSDLVGDAQFGVNVGECSEGVCDAVVCQNGGSCVTQSADRHICLCPLGYGGENCQHVTQVHIPEFSGHSFLQYTGLGRTALLFLEIELVIKSNKPDGLILYNGYTLDRQGDFISLAMSGGHLEFRFDLGTGPAVIRSAEPVDLKTWHWIKISRTGREGIMEVDDQVAAISQSPGAFTQLTLTQDMFIGGHHNFDQTSKFANLSVGFDGCIQKFTVNNHAVKLIDDAVSGINVESCEHPCIGQPCLNGGECVPRKDVYTCYCPLGFTHSNCEMVLDKDTDVPEFTGESFLMYTQKKIAKRIGGNKFDLRFFIRPKSPDGLLFWSGQDEMGTTSDYVALGFVDGALQFRYNLGSGDALMSYNDTRLFDGSWHEIHAQRDKQDGYLMVDEREIVEGSSKGSYTMLNTNNALYIGGMPDVSENTLRRFRTGYEGCLRSVVLGEDYPIELVQTAQSGRNIQECSSQT